MSSVRECKMSYGDAEQILLPICLEHFKPYKQNNVLYIQGKDGPMVFTRHENHGTTHELYMLSDKFRSEDGEENELRNRACRNTLCSSTRMTKFRNNFYKYAMENAKEKVYCEQAAGEEVSSNPTFSIMEFVYNNVLLSKEEMLRGISTVMPQVLTDTSVAEVILRYTILYANMIVVDELRSQFCEEMHKKKCIPTKGTKQHYKPVDPMDTDYMVSFIYLGKTSYNSYIGYSAVMKHALEDILFDQLNSISCSNDYDRIIDIVHSGLDRVSEHDSIYQENWRTNLPVLLTDDTNVLTRADKTQIKRFPLWVKEGLQMVHSYIEEVRHMLSNNDYINVRLKIQKELKCLDKILSYTDSM